ncbi:hypothetical protein CDAR_50721 [Caerostris darwini]|uniref:Uncharacterized protein n=1 Tax=Caerostris darwini TaxID=1538125 RepID=A0AAV4UXB1_9ARAC|nr:hypothetical protein CDAR_50721 [Caerostris darwini]
MEIHSRSAPLAGASRGAQLSPNAFNEVARGGDAARHPISTASIRGTLHCVQKLFDSLSMGSPAALSIVWGRKWEILGQFRIRTVIAPPTPLPGRKSIREEIEIGV